MIARTLFASALANVVRIAKLIPGLLRHDPLFRYAAIAAVLAVFFLMARITQEFAGPGAIPPGGTNRAEQNIAHPDDRSAADENPPPPGSSTTPPAPGEATPPAIAPGRSLEGVNVEPAPRDRFGTLPRGENPE